MSQELLDLCAQAIAAAKKAGAADSKATLTRLHSIDIQYRQRKPETIKQSATQGLDTEIYVDGRYSRQNTSDLRPSALTDFIGNAVATTRLLAEDRFRTLPEPRRYQGRPEGDLKILDPGFAGVTVEQRHKVVQRLEESALAAGGSQVLSVTAGIRDLLYEMTAVTSNGLSGEVKTSEFHLSGEMTLQDAGDRRPNGYYYLTTRLSNSPIQQPWARNWQTGRKVCWAQGRSPPSPCP
jgi:PmbA protein